MFLVGRRTRVASAQKCECTYMYVIMYVSRAGERESERESVSQPWAQPGWKYRLQAKQAPDPYPPARTSQTPHTHTHRYISKYIHIDT